jgi:GPH family glycoside/pentoside/hexuronide:cation symporter
VTEQSTDIPGKPPEEDAVGILPTGKLPLKTLLSYGTSMIGLNGMSTMITVHLMIFYTDVLLVGSAVVGVVMAISQIWDAVTDPVLGYVSDHTPWKWGRRRPYILLGSVPASIFFFFVFAPPRSFSPQMISIFFGFMFLSFFTCRTIWETPYFALAPELTLDYDERTRLSAYQQVFASFGDILGTMAPLLFISMFAVERTGYARLGLVLAFVGIATAFVTYAGTRENPTLSKKSELSLKDSLAATVRNRPYLLLVVTSTCTAISNYTTIAVMRYLVKYWFKRPDLEVWVFVAFFVGVFVSIPIWIRVIRHTGKKAAFMFTMAFYAALLWLIMLLGQDDFVIFAAVNVVAGAFNVALWLIAGSIMPDIIEWDQLQVGERREGAYYGIWTLIRKAGSAAPYIIVAIVFNLVGYEPNVEQTDLSLLGIRLLFGPIPSMLLIVGIIVFIRFPITKQVHQEMVRQIEEMQKKEESSRS